MTLEHLLLEKLDYIEHELHLVKCELAAVRGTLDNHHDENRT